MIVILSYYYDGSGKPEMKFFPKVDGQAREVAVHTSLETGLGKNIEIYEVENIQLPVSQIK